MHYPRKRGLRINLINKIGFSYLFISIGIALVSTIWAIYLESFLHNASLVGFLSTFFIIIGILSFLFFIPIVEKSSKTRLLTISLIIFVISYFLFSLFSNIYLVIFISILISIFASLRITVFGIIIRDKSKNKSVSKNEGFIYTLLNLTWLIGPLIAGYLSKKYNFNLVFLVASLLTLISLILFNIFRIKDDRTSKKTDYNILKVILNFFSKRERIKAYILSGSVTFWWALIYIYVPIYIIENGFSSILVGIFLSGIVIPLISLEYFFGKLAGKKGFKKLFFYGCLILSLIALISFFTKNIYIILTLLILASIGISMIESTSEAYFFDIINKEERDKYYSIYNTALDTGYFTGTLPAAIILAFLPFKFIFLFFAIAMFIISLVPLKMKDVLEYKRK